MYLSGAGTEILIGREEADLGIEEAVGDRAVRRRRRVQPSLGGPWRLLPSLGRKQEAASAWRTAGRARPAIRTWGTGGRCG